MSAERFNTQFSAQAEVESSYGSAVSPFTVSQLRLNEAAIMRERFVADLRRASQHAVHEYVRYGKVGRYFETTISHEMGGPVSAWSASVVPSAHHLLRGCGLSATLDATGGTESWTYVPVVAPASSPTSLSIQSWWHGLTAKMKGAIGSFEFEADGLNMPKWMFNYKGMLDAAISDAAPSLSASFGSVATTIPLAQNAVVNIGAYVAPKVRSFKFTQNHEIEVRANQTALGGSPGANVWGFSTNTMRAEFEVVIEAPVLSVADGIGTGAAGINPSNLELTGSTIDFKYKTYTGGSYASYRFEVPRAQVTEWEADAAGSIVLWRLKAIAPLPIDIPTPYYPWRLVFPTS